MDRLPDEILEQIISHVLAPDPSTPTQPICLEKIFLESNPFTRSIRNTDHYKDYLIASSTTSRLRRISLPLFYASKIFMFRSRNAWVLRGALSFHPLPTAFTYIRTINLILDIPTLQVMLNIPTWPNDFQIPSFLLRAKKEDYPCLKRVGVLSSGFYDFERPKRGISEGEYEFRMLPEGIRNEIDARGIAWKGLEIGVLVPPGVNGEMLWFIIGEYVRAGLKGVKKSRGLKRIAILEAT